MSTTYRCTVKAKSGKTVEIDAGHRGTFKISGGERPIASDLLGLALYLDVVNHKDIEVTPSPTSPTKPEAAPNVPNVPKVAKAIKLTGDDGHADPGDRE